MTTAFMTPTFKIEIAAKKDRLIAELPDGTLVGTAERRFGRREDDWVGWLVTVGARRTVVDTRLSARERLESWASGAVAV